MIKSKIYGPESPLELRETLLEKLRIQKKIRLSPEERVVISTCDRVEFYSGDGPATRETARLLFELCAGLRSPFLGEVAILGQVKRAYEEAALAGSLSKGLHVLFQAALACGKKVRSTTGLSKGALGHGQAAVKLLIEEFGGGKEIAKKKVVLVGVNKLNQNILAYFSRLGLKNCCIINRNLPKALEFAKAFSYESKPFSELASETVLADAVISATSAPHVLIKPESHRFKEGAVLIDLAVPRDFHADFSTDPRFRYFDVQHLERRIAKVRVQRQDEIVLAKGIIEFELDRYEKKYERILQHEGC